MSAKQIKDHFGAFVETARREPVIHTHHGREVLVTMSIEKAHEHHVLPKLPHAKPTTPVKRNALLDIIGKWHHLSAYKSDEEILETIRAMREDRY
jgi:hypothetical protein